MLALRAFKYWKASSSPHVSTRLATRLYTVPEDWGVGIWIWPRYSGLRRSFQVVGTEAPLRWSHWVLMATPMGFI